MSITNATRLSDFAAGIGTEGAILQIDNANQRVGIGTQLPSQMLEVAGIVTATAFHGDGSLLEGIKSAGLGTAIGDSNTVEEVIYYTDDLLTVAETTTVNPPASASAAYTQYRDVKLNDSVDLIIETGDDFIPDILGFGDDTSDPNAAGNGVFDEVYTSIIKNKDGLGAPAFANGLTSVGVITATGGFAGNVTGDVTGNVNNSTNLSLKTNNAERVRIDQYGRVMIGTDTAGEGSADDLNIATTGQTGITIRSGTSSGGQIYFADGTSGDDRQRGIISYQHGGNYMRFYTNASERLRITEDGAFGIGGANYGTAGHVLTSGGASAAPQWAAVSGGYGTVVDEWNIEGSPTYGTVTVPSAGAYLNSGTGWPNGGGQGNTHRTGLHAGSTGVSWSNEVVSFPSTGQWKIEVYIGLINNAAGKIVLIVEKSTDNGSSWNWLRYAATEQASISNLYLTSFFNVTDTSNNKVKFKMDSTTQNQANFECGTSDRTLYNSIIFTKVA